MSGSIIVSDPDVLGGAPTFAGTRVPVKVLFENLADGVGLEEILEEYPTLTREHVVAVLLQADRLIERTAS